ncbi:helix-turn-helix transcriptional regulator [Blautia producta]|uniref:helix-turn-helix transcriptional regulator n=1 Tax=Blautia producta TaxID=33035 RepID=UPI0031B5F769
MEKHSKNTRTLNMYARLCEGKTLNKREESLRFGVDERSIQRDIDDIRAFLEERSVMDFGENRNVVYDRDKKGYIISGEHGSMMTNSEILAVSKILLESRAFTKNEISIILKKLVDGCAPKESMKLVTDLISNEKYHYIELHHKSCIQDKLWALGMHIKQCNLLEIEYQKQGVSLDRVKRLVQPVAILFSEYYFYLNAYIVEKDEEGKNTAKYEYPAIFRVDRIKKFRETGESFKIAYANRFEEGEFRKRTQFMYAGKLTKVQFSYTGPSVEAILDRLPTARVISETEDGYIIEAEVYGKGLMMWLLSQGNFIEVLKPESMRDEMKSILSDMSAKYQN